MDKLYELRAAALKSPHTYGAVAIVLIVAVLLFLYSFLKKRKRKSQSHTFLCERNRKTVLDGLHSFYLANPKAEFTVTVKDLVARDILKEKKSLCPAGRPYELFLSRDEKGNLKNATVTCKSHGDTNLADI